MPTFHLVTPEGEPLGDIVVASDVWEPGDVIPRGPGKALRIVEVRHPPATRSAGTLVVEPLE